MWSEDDPWHLTWQVTFPGVEGQAVSSFVSYGLFHPVLQDQPQRLVKTVNLPWIRCCMQHCFSHSVLDFYGPVTCLAREHFSLLFHNIFRKFLNIFWKQMWIMPSNFSNDIYTYNFHVFFCTCLTINPYKGVTFRADRDCSQTRNCHSQVIALLVMKQSLVQCFNFKKWL